MVWWTRRRNGDEVVAAAAESWPGSVDALRGKVHDERVPVARHNRDGSVDEGTAAVVRIGAALRLVDFRDIDGRPLDLPPGASFRARVPLDPR